MAHWGTTRSSVWLCVMLFIAIVWGASAGQASLTFDLVIEYSDGTAPEGPTPWLSAKFEDSGVDEVKLTLSTPNLTDEENVKVWMFNLDPDYEPTDLAFSAPSAGDFTAPSAFTRAIDILGFKADGDGYFDIKIEFDNSDGSASRFGVGDAVVYTITYTPGGNVLTADSFDFISEPDGGQGEYKTVAHVGSIGAGADSGWIATPEPTTLGMVLLGGLAMLRRKRST